MLISPSFRNIANYIFSNLTPSTKCFNNEREKNNTCIMTIIKIVLIFRFVMLPAAKQKYIYIYCYCYFVIIYFIYYK